MSSDLSRRLAVAGVGIPVGILVIYLGGWVLGVTLALVAAAGTAELYALSESTSDAGAGRANGRPFRALGIATALLLIVLVTRDPVWHVLATAGWILTILLFLGALGLAVFRRGPEEGPLHAVAVTVAGVLYVAGTLAFALLIRHLPESGGTEIGVEAWHGAALLLFPLVATWFGDSAAYFAGSRWGKRKLLPTVSPKKTVVGGVASLLGAVLVGAVLGATVLNDLPAYSVSPLSGAVIGLIIGFVGQVGDLGESLLKREAGVKDSGSLLPGHGGVLDRFDGVLLTLPLAYFLIVLNSLAGF